MPYQSVTSGTPATRISAGEPALLGQRLERSLRPGAEMLDHLGGGERAEARGALVADPLRDAKEEARRKQVAGTGGVDHALDRRGRDGEHPVARGDDAALLAARHHGESRLAPQRRQRGVEVRRLVKAVQLRL